MTGDGRVLETVKDELFVFEWICEMEGRGVEEMGDPTRIDGSVCE